MASTSKTIAWKIAFSGFAICAVATATLSAAPALGQGSDWPMGGHDLNNSRNQAATAINTGNVASLTLKWAFTTGGAVAATPAVWNGLLFFPDQAGNFYAVNALSGQAIWTRKVQSWTGFANDFSKDDPVLTPINGLPAIIMGNRACAIYRRRAARPRRVAHGRGRIHRHFDLEDQNRGLSGRGGHQFPGC
jgi:hypothetical protein